MSDSRARPRRPRTLAGTLLLAAFGWASSGQAQPKARPAAQPPPDDEIFFESIEVNVVNVEVFVTDSKGNPVQGLKKEDFELLEEGKPVEITNFLAIREGQLVSEDEATSPSVLPPRAAAIPRSQRLHVVVMLDHFNLAPRHRNQILSHLRRFLRESLDNEDRVMLASFDGSMHIEQGFTSVPELLQPLLDTMSERNSRAHEVEAGLRSILREIEDVSLNDTSAAVNFAQEQARGILLSIQSYSQEIHDRNRLTLEAMGRLVDSLSGLEGRKALLYVSSGMPMRPGEVLLEAWNNKFQGFARTLGVGSVAAAGLEFDSTQDFQRLVAAASANRVVIYTIDAVAQRDFGATAAEVGGFDLSAVSTAGGGHTLPVELGSRQNSNVRSSMQILASGTGGLTFINSKALGSNLASLSDDFKTYYSLGYSPERRGDGGFRHLKVRVPGGDFRIRHRSGFRDKTPDEEMGERTLSALLLNVSENPLQVTLERAADREGSKRGLVQVPILIKIPIANLALLPDPEFHRGKVAVFVAVADSEGGNSKVERRDLPVKIPSERINEALKQYIGHELALEMRRGFHRLAIGVRDEIAGVTSTVRFNFRTSDEKPGR